MANEINSDAPTHDEMRYEVKAPDGSKVGEAASASSALLLDAVVREQYGDGSTVTPKGKK